LAWETALRALLGLSWHQLLAGLLALVNTTDGHAALRDHTAWGRIVSLILGRRHINLWRHVGGFVDPNALHFDGIFDLIDGHAHLSD
jgi:hypothetical protein